VKAGKGKKGHSGKDNGRKSKVRRKFVETMNAAASKGAMKAPIKDTLSEEESEGEDC
jgi:hypothetical protein